MLHSSSTRALHALAHSLATDFNESSQYTSVDFENSYGRGTAKAISVFEGLELLTGNLLLKKSVKLSFKSIQYDYLHFTFIEEGYIIHNFQHSEKERTAYRNQNVIVGSNSGDYSSFKLDKHVKTQFLILTVEKSLISTSKRSDILQSQINEIFQSISTSNSYAYFGGFSTKPSSLVATVLKTPFSNLFNKLQIQASILQFLAIQLKDHNDLKCDKPVDNQLTQLECVSILRLSEYINRNLDKPLKLDHLEKESGLHQKLIQNGFQHFYGMTVNKYILSLRAIKAKELIERTDLSISEIVYQIGFNSRSYFSKIFSSKFGIQPNEYRKNLHIADPTYELSYYSKVSDKFTKSDFTSLLKTSITNNEKLGVSGCLVYHKNYFFQLLEGTRTAIDKIYQKIENDPRHTNVILLYQGFKSGRTFEKWSLAFVKTPSFYNRLYNIDCVLINAEMILLSLSREDTQDSNRLKAKVLWDRIRNELIIQQERKLNNISLH
ncbi:BLUF domain-containing protein [Aquimarina sp. W85]|uniref:BLUF domain-containing protein n=1 Tax=Aquimarina rhodophyticola TaxID=3342246 RepID=UPI00366B664F